MLFYQQADTNKGAVVCNYVRGVASHAQSELVQVGYSRAWLSAGASAGASADTEVSALGLYKTFLFFVSAFILEMQTVASNNKRA